jgi:allophanate hydrolase
MNHSNLKKIAEGGIQSLRNAYLDKLLTPGALCEEISKRAVELSSCNIWITPPNRNIFGPYIDNLGPIDFVKKPLWGLPFAIKDNIDLSGVETTAGCAAFSYLPSENAFVVQKLIEAGAIPIGKTNMDQFATGLVGTRSPFGITTHPERPGLISGGSSSGSAIAVASGLVAFALGTDTAGSGRVPAALNGIVGFKPTRGLISCNGVVPACKSIDCVSIFALSPSDAALVADVCIGFDDNYSFARKNDHYKVVQAEMSSIGGLTCGFVDSKWLQGGDPTYRKAYEATLNSLETSGVKLIEIEYAPFVDAGEELYSGPWVAERTLSVGEFLSKGEGDVMDVTREIILGGKARTAEEVFASIYRLASFKQRCEEELDKVDVLITPTVSSHPSIEQVANEPIAANNAMGKFTNYMNLLDLCGVAIPGIDVDDGRPFGITLVAKAMADATLMDTALVIQRFIAGEGSISSEKGLLDRKRMEIVVCGAHMEGLPLNHQLVERGGVLKMKTTTSKTYELYALPGGPPERPGLVETAEGGAEIQVEVWEILSSTVGSFLAGIPKPLGLGSIRLAGGSVKQGFICEGIGIRGATNITEFGGWRAYVESKV